MRTAFGDDGMCFRIGGDEFFVMCGYEKDDPRLQAKLDSFTSLVAEFNSDETRKIPLSMAYGYTVFVPGEGDIEECIREADKRMYEMKVKMKAVRE